LTLVPYIRKFAHPQIRTLTKVLHLLLVKKQFFRYLYPIEPPDKIHFSDEKTATGSDPFDNPGDAGANGL
jgi:hypothetical protein